MPIAVDLDGMMPIALDLHGMMPIAVDVDGNDCRSEPCA